MLEGRFADASGSGRLMKAMTEDGSKLAGWNECTLQHYISVGCHLNAGHVRNWLIVWETKFKRSSLLDGMLLLRACVSVTANDTELAQLIHILFLEQCCGLNKNT